MIGRLSDTLGEAQVLKRDGDQVGRYGREHKPATRQRILQSAAQRFKGDGFNGVGVAQLMAEAGLTNGAFYGHFASKDDLVAHVVADQLRAQREALDAIPPERAAMEAFIRGYLSPEHRDGIDQGCPSAALLDEIARCSDDVRGVYTEGIRAIVDVIADHLPQRDPGRARADTLAVLTLMIATVQLARAVSDPHFSDEILEQGINNALAYLDSD